MIVLELHGVEIDNCTGCGGIWLDAGELELLLEETSKKNELLSSLTTEKTSREKKRRCPICRKKMVKILCGPEKKILIDKCSRGDGLWFDQNELEEVITLGSLDKENKVLNLLQDMFGKKNDPEIA